MSNQFPFEVNAGKYDNGERNYKYCDYAETLDQAIIMYQSVSDYPWVELIYYGIDNTKWEITVTPILEKGN